MEPNPDILASVVAREDKPIVVGFAAETGSIERAIEKAQRKDVDLLVYNDVTEPGSGFGTDTNRVTFIDRGGSITPLPLTSKAEVARHIVDQVVGLIEGSG